MIKHSLISQSCAVAVAATAFLVSTANAETINVTPASIAGGVPNANDRRDHPPNLLPPGFSLRLVAQGGDALENPSGLITNFGYLNDASKQPVEATKTEPDENTYLILNKNPGGPTAGFDYGRHFLFQGHEVGSDHAYVTRINLDVADPDRRITLMTKGGTTGFNFIDGSTFNPFTGTLLFTQENGTTGGVIEVSPDFDATKGAATLLRTLYGIMGRAGFEGIHPDNNGNIYLVEDTGGTKVPTHPQDPNSPVVAKNPNSFVYRLIPYNKADLTAGGKLQALQVSINNQPVVFVPVDATHPTGDVFSANQLKLHTTGISHPVKWITVHDTATNGFASFDANAAAKAAGATPFKRPENMAFLPGSNFRTFFFDPTGDTDSQSGSVSALAARGAWGSIFRVDLQGDLDAGRISIFVLGDKVHNSFDNLTFASNNLLLAAEDRGDLLHDELNTLDSIWAYNVDHPASDGVRFVALGRDRASQADAAFAAAGTPGFQNDGDNEPTGLLFSDGKSLLGSAFPKPDGVLFFTQQHGENNVYQVTGGTGDHTCDLFF